MKLHSASPHGRTHQTLRLLAAVAPLAALTAGCIFVVPVPTACHTAESRRNITEATTTRFAPGKATVEDVVLALGEPDQAASDASRLTYGWERVNMHLVWGWAIPAAEASVGQGWETIYSHEYSLSFAFDQSGVLQNLKTTNINVQTTTETSP